RAWRASHETRYLPRYRVSARLSGLWPQIPGVEESTRFLKDLSILVRRDHLAAVDGGQREERPVGDRVLEEADRAVGEEEVDAAGVAAAEVLGVAGRTVGPAAGGSGPPALRSYGVPCQYRMGQPVYGSPAQQTSEVRDVKSFATTVPHPAWRHALD